MRPPLKPSDPGYELIPQRFQRSMVHVTAPTSVAVDVPQGRKLFVFDRVFAESVNQQGVWEYLSDSVGSFLQGYNVSILAYGQSGAGKSYTMGTSGPNEQNNFEAMGKKNCAGTNSSSSSSFSSYTADDLPILGVIPRAAQLLFDQLDGPAKHNRNSSTGLRTPSRYSTSSSSSFGKGSGFDKNWQLKATYVEVRISLISSSLNPVVACCSILTGLDLQRTTARSARPRFDPGARTSPRHHSRGYQRSHYSHRSPPGQHQFL